MRAIGAAVGAGLALAALAAAPAMAAGELSVGPATRRPPRGRGGHAGPGPRVRGRAVLRPGLAHHGGDGRHRHAPAQAARLGLVRGRRPVDRQGDAVHERRRLRPLRPAAHGGDRRGAHRRRAGRRPRRAARARAAQPGQRGAHRAHPGRRALRAHGPVPVGLRQRRPQGERQRARHRRLRGRPARVPRHRTAPGRGRSALLHRDGRLRSRARDRRGRPGPLRPERHGPRPAPHAGSDAGADAEGLRRRPVRQGHRRPAHLRAQAALGRLAVALDRRGRVGRLAGRRALRAARADA